MKESAKAILVNLVIIAVLLGINFIATSGQEHYFFGRFAFAGLLILFAGLINIGIGIGKLVRRNNGGELFLLSGGVILLIGFSVCTKLA